MVISMERWKGKVAVVTGAGGGIGAAVVEQLARVGLQVVGLDLKTEGIEKLAKNLQGCPGTVYPIQADLTKEEDILNAFKWIKENVGPVHVLINSAGCAKNTTLIEGETNLWKTVIDTNVLGLCIATREAVKTMRENNIDGHIIHVNSNAGHKVPFFPNFNVYSASKHAVTALTETLRQELNCIGSKIKITSVSPAATATKFMDLAGFDESSEIKKMQKGSPELKAEDVADCIMFVLGTPPNVQVHELLVLPVGYKV